MSDFNVTQSESDGRQQVLICCEDGGDFPGDWVDLRITVEWAA